jgi:hypothetical protein
VIVALPSLPTSDAAHRWIGLTEDCDSFAEKVSCIMNPRLFHEAARLRDVQLVRLENRPRSFRKFLTLNCPGTKSFVRKCHPGQTVCASGPPAAPSSDPLPCQFACAVVPLRGE